MYNLGMKNKVKNIVKNTLDKYIYNILLTLIIFILFCILGYSKDITEFKLYLGDSEANVINRIYNLNNEHYIHIDDLTNIFKDNIYHDKISGKIIITTYDSLIKIDKDDDKYIIKDKQDVYFNLKKVMEHLENNVVYSQDKICVLPQKYICGNIKNNRVELYDKQTGSVIGHLSKLTQVKVYVDENLKNNDKIISVEARIQGKLCYGYVLKNNVEYEYTASQEVVNNKKIILVKAEDNISTSTDKSKVDMVSINMYRLSGVNALTKLQNVDTTLQGVEVVATINNGQKAANYDQNIISSMLNSESNRQDIIQQILSGTSSLAGVNLDFGNLKVADKEKYTQFVKELAAIMHKNNKILIVNITTTQNIDCEQISKFADYIVLQPYYARSISSKTSGPISSISYVEEYINNILSKDIDTNKVILEVPAYTILWTERRGTVINAEQYNMKMMESYVKQNKLEVKLDKSSGQNYINYTKGITTYKMWLEDGYSITEKTKLVNKYNLAGLSIYKSGMEIKGIYSDISKILNK